MRRIAELDGLRGLAAVLIVAYHLFRDYPPGFWAAVDLFFVLSGYLITAIVLRHACSWRFLLAFYARRGLRIWPIYYLVILILVLGVGRRGDLVALPYYLTYTQQFPHYWGGAMPDWKEMGIAASRRTRNRSDWASGRVILASRPGWGGARWRAIVIVVG